MAVGVGTGSGVAGIVGSVAEAEVLSTGAGEEGTASGVGLVGSVGFVCGSI